MLKPQDIVLALKLFVKEKEAWSQGSLAQELVMSASEVNAGIKRLAYAGLIEHQEDGRRWKIVKPALQEFLIHGIKYVFPAEKGAPSFGMPTSNASKPLTELVNDATDFPVWPVKQAKSKGYAFLPLYTTVPQAAKNDQKLYELLVIVDALRDNDNEKMDVAQVLLKSKLSGRKQKAEKPEIATVEDPDQQVDLFTL